MDKNRILVIALTRLLKRLINKINESVNPAESPYQRYLTTLYQIAEEFILQPVIIHFDNAK